MNNSSKKMPFRPSNYRCSYCGDTPRHYWLVHPLLLLCFTQLKTAVGLGRRSFEKVAMVLKLLVIEMGMGVDQHGQELTFRQSSVTTVAAARAVRNAIAFHSFRLSSACRYKDVRTFLKLIFCLT